MDGKTTKNYAAAIGGEILAELKANFAAAKLTLTPDDERLIERLSNDAATLHLEAALVPAGPLRDGLLEELKIVDASLTNLSAVAVETGRSLFWNSVKTVIARVVGLAFAMLA